MGHQMIVDVSEETYEILARAAKASGTTPEDCASAWLTMIAQDAAHDPLEEFIGAIRSDVPDWGDHHDKYLGQSLQKELRGKDDPER